MEQLAELAKVLNGLSPLAIIGLLSWIVYLLVAKKGPMRRLSENHLHGLPAMEASLTRIEETLGEIRDGINYLKGRINGRN